MDWEGDQMDPGLSAPGHGTRPEMLSFADWNGLKVEEDLKSLGRLGPLGSMDADGSHIWSWSNLKSLSHSSVPQAVCRRNHSI